MTPEPSGPSRLPRAEPHSEATTSPAPVNGAHHKPLPQTAIQRVANARQLLGTLGRGPIQSVSQLLASIDNQLKLATEELEKDAALRAEIRALVERDPEARASLAAIASQTSIATQLDHEELVAQADGGL